MTPPRPSFDPILRLSNRIHTFDSHLDSRSPFDKSAGFNLRLPFSRPYTRPTQHSTLLNTTRSWRSHLLSKCCCVARPQSRHQPISRCLRHRRQSGWTFRHVQMALAQINRRRSTGHRLRSALECFRNPWHVFSCECASSTRSHFARPASR